MAEAFEVVKNLDCEVWCVSNDGKPKPECRCDRFFEKVPMEQMRRIYSSCDILLKLSRVEGFFGPPLEMMACNGVPIVAKVTGHDEYIRNNHNALVVRPGDLQQAASAINKLISSPKLFSTLQKNCRKTVENHCWDSSILKLQKYFDYES